MKKSELRKMISEEIQKINEEKIKVWKHKWLPYEVHSSGNKYLLTKPNKGLHNNTGWTKHSLTKKELDKELKKYDTTLDDFIKEGLLNEISDYYEIEYYDHTGGHGGIGNTPDFNKSYKKAIELYKREKKENIPQGSTGYIGVSSNTNKFAIVFIDEKYYNLISTNWFNNTNDYKNWKTVAAKVLKTKKPQIGTFE